MDREKVIKGLKEIVNFFDIMSAIEGRCNELKQDAENAIDFLKEQEAVEPVTESSVYDPDTWFFVCGSCKKGVINRGDKFCRWCGQAVKWDE